MTASRDPITAAIRIAADAPTYKPYRYKAERTFIKKSYVEELRTALDKAGLGDDWRALHQVVRIEERQPSEAPS